MNAAQTKLEKLTMRSRFLLMIVALFAFAHGAHAQEGAKPTGEPPAASDRGQVDHSQMGHGAESPPPAPTAPAQEDHSKHGAAPARPAPASGGRETGGAMEHGAMQGGKAPPDARDPHAYAEGYGFGPMRPDMGDDDYFGQFLADRFEGADTGEGSALLYDALAWYGSVYNRAWLRAEGDREEGATAARTELLWGHAVAPFWDAQVGVRYDTGPGEDRPWLAFGVQGIAPYRFNVEATAYVGEEGRSAVRVETEYEWLFTQRLVLQPRFETNLYGKSDAERGLGSGLADAALGLRLRYEIRREFAPYVGIEYARKFGGTADLARAAGNDADDMLYVAGLRFWF